MYQKIKEKNKLLISWIPATLKYIIKTMETKSCFQFEIIINVLALSASFEYLGSGSKAIINVLTLSGRGSTLDV